MFPLMGVQKWGGSSFVHATKRSDFAQGFPAISRANSKKNPDTGGGIVLSSQGARRRLSVNLPLLRVALRSTAAEKWTRRSNLLERIGHLPHP